MKIMKRSRSGGRHVGLTLSIRRLKLIIHWLHRGLCDPRTPLMRKGYEMKWLLGSRVVIMRLTRRVLQYILLSTRPILRTMIQMATLKQAVYIMVMINMDFLKYSVLQSLKNYQGRSQFCNLYIQFCNLKYSGQISKELFA